MSLYKICEWENNYHNDSDFFIGVYDDEEKRCKKVEIGSTRHAGGIVYPELESLTFEIAKKARQWLEDCWFSRMKVSDKRQVNEPTKIDKGEEIKVISKHQNNKMTKVCEGCNGTGEWRNPKNFKDLRECFKCNGKGIVRQKSKKRIKIEEASIGKVVSCNLRYGYNSRYREHGPGRYDYDCVVKLSDGQIICIPLEKLCLSREPYSDEYLRERARTRSSNFEFGQFLGAVAWLTTNDVARVFSEKEQENKRRESEILTSAIRLLAKIDDMCDAEDVLKTLDITSNELEVLKRKLNVGKTKEC